MRRARIACCLLLAVAGCQGGGEDSVDHRAEIAALRARVASLEQQLGEETGQKKGEIKAAGFVLIGPDGKVKARLGFDRLGKFDAVPGFYVYDKNGTKRVTVVETGWGGGVGVYDSLGRTRVGLCDRGLFRHWELEKSHPRDRSSAPGDAGATEMFRITYPEKSPPKNWVSDHPPSN